MMYPSHFGRWALVFMTFAALACTSSADKIKFVRKGDDFVLPPRIFDRYAKRIAGADKPEDLAALLDRGYSIADSLSGIAGTCTTLQLFADGMEARFFDPQSPLRDDRIYSLALEREKSCECFSSSERKRLIWKKNLLGRNVVGAKVANIPLTDAYGKGCTLAELTDRLTVILLYGEQCRACENLTDAVLESADFKAWVADTVSCRLLAVYTGEDDGAFRGMSAKLKGWQHFKDSEQTVMMDNSFDSRLIPSIYVVSAEGQVVLKASTDVAEAAEAVRRASSSKR